MKKTLLTLVLALVQILTFAQAPAMQWQKSFGGISSEAIRSVQQTSDGGYIVGGYKSLNSTDPTGNQNMDAWILKLNMNGDIEWEKTFGGTLTETAASILQTNDGGFIFATWSNSNDGDVTGNHGGADFWVVKMSSSGDIEWQKSYGGTAPDLGMSINKTNDGGYIISGNTQSNDGDVSGNHGAGDAWVLKINNIGVIQWQKTLGGSSQEQLMEPVQQTPDGGYIVAVISESNDGDVTGNHGEADSWIVKLNSVGDIEWQKSFGQSGYDVVYEIKNTLDGGFIFVGGTSNNTGDFSGNHGGIDIWVVKINNIGIVQWQKLLGGSNSDGGSSIIETNDGGFIVGGSTESIDGDITLNHGSVDWWIVKLTNLGTIEWQKTLGGTLDEGLNRINKTADGGYILGGYSNSSNGDLTSNNGDNDFWVVKLASDCTSPPTANAQTFCSSATVADLAATGTALKWYADNTTTTTLASTAAIATGTYYVSQTLNGCESARTLVAVTVNVTPVIVPTEVVNVTVCDVYALPLLTVGHYFSDALHLNPITNFTLTTTTMVYVYAENGVAPNNCYDIASFLVTINNVPFINPIAPVFACNTYIIPQYNAPMFTSTNPITKFYTNAGGPANNPLPSDEYLPGQIIINPGNTIPWLVTIYAYSAVGSAPCFYDEPFVVTISNTPVIVPAEVVDVTACNAYTLPALTVGNYFYDAAHTQPITNLVLTAPSTVVYVYAENSSTPNCTAIESFVVNIVNTPTAPTGAALQTFTVTPPADATIANLVVAPSNVIWYASLTDAQTGTNPLQSTTVLTSFATYFAVNSANGCASDPFAVQVSVTLGNPTFSALSLQLYPNPVKTILFVQPSNKMTINKITITDLAGKIVLMQTTNTNQVNVDQLASGMYIIEAISGKVKFINKFIKN